MICAIDYEDFRKVCCDIVIKTAVQQLHQGCSCYFHYTSFNCTFRQFAHDQNSIKNFLADQTTSHSKRLVRTLCECLDRIGLAHLEGLGTASSVITKLSRLAFSSGYYDHAYAYANIAFDKWDNSVIQSNVEVYRFVSFERPFIAVGGHVPENEELTNLLADIYVATENAAAIDSLPVWAQVLKIV